jgi:hypothetical protein
MTIVTNWHSLASIYHAISACLALEAPMCRRGSRQSYKIKTCFDALVHCSECQAARAMAIKTIRAGMSGGKDEIIYQCEQCGTEMSKFGE